VGEYARISSRRSIYFVGSLLLLQFWLAWPLTVSARLGILQTRDGTVWKGQIRFGTNGVTVINAPTESLVTIELTNVSDLFFDPALDSAQEYSQGDFSHPVQKWQAEDIGFTNAAGSVVVDSGFVRVRSVGTNIA